MSSLNPPPPRPNDDERMQDTTMTQGNQDGTGAQQETNNPSSISRDNQDNLSPEKRWEIKLNKANSLFGSVKKYGAVSGSSLPAKRPRSPSPPAERKQPEHDSNRVKLTPMSIFTKPQDIEFPSLRLAKNIRKENELESVSLEKAQKPVFNRQGLRGRLQGSNFGRTPMPLLGHSCSFGPSPSSPSVARPHMAEQSGRNDVSMTIPVQLGNTHEMKTSIAFSVPPFYHLLMMCIDTIEKQGESDITDLHEVQPVLALQFQITKLDAWFWNLSSDFGKAGFENVSATDRPKRRNLANFRTLAASMVIRLGEVGLNMSRYGTLSDAEYESTVGLKNELKGVINKWRAYVSELHQKIQQYRTSILQDLKSFNENSGLYQYSRQDHLQFLVSFSLHGQQWLKVLDESVRVGYLILQAWDECVVQIVDCCEDRSHLTKLAERLVGQVHELFEKGISARLATATTSIRKEISEFWLQSSTHIPPNNVKGDFVRCWGPLHTRFLDCMPTITMSQMANAKKDGPLTEDGLPDRTQEVTLTHSAPQLPHPGSTMEMGAYTFARPANNEGLPFMTFPNDPPIKDIGHQGYYAQLKQNSMEMLHPASEDMKADGAKTKRTQDSLTKALDQILQPQISEQTQANTAQREAETDAIDGLGDAMELIEKELEEELVEDDDEYLDYNSRDENDPKEKGADDEEAARIADQLMLEAEEDIS